MEDIKKEEEILEGEKVEETPEKLERIKQKNKRQSTFFYRA